MWKEERPGLKSLAGAFLTDAGLSAAFLFRHAARLLRRGHPLLAFLVGRINIALHGCQIHPLAEIGPGLCLPHPVGVVVGRGVRAGRDLTLFQNVTLGAKSLRGEDYPVIGDGVVVFPHSLVFGSIKVGDGSTVGAGSVVLHDVSEGETVVGAPAVPLRRTGMRQGAQNPQERI